MLYVACKPEVCKIEQLSDAFFQPNFDLRLQHRLTIGAHAKKKAIILVPFKILNSPIKSLIARWKEDYCPPACGENMYAPVERFAGLTASHGRWGGRLPERAAFSKNRLTFESEIG